MHNCMCISAIMLHSIHSTQPWICNTWHSRYHCYIHSQILPHTTWQQDSILYRGVFTSKCTPTIWVNSLNWAHYMFTEHSEHVEHVISLMYSVGGVSGWSLVTQSTSCRVYSCPSAPYFACHSSMYLRLCRLYESPSMNWHPRKLMSYFFQRSPWGCSFLTLGQPPEPEWIKTAGGSQSGCVDVCIQRLHTPHVAW